MRERYTQTFTVPSTSGSYAFERLTFGEVPAGVYPVSYEGITAKVDTSVASMVVELWLPKAGVTKHPSQYVDDDYTYSGQALDAATGGETFVLADYPGAQIRVKSGGTGGSAVVSASSR